MFKIGLATIGVCVFYASTSVGAFFNLQINTTNLGVQFSFFQLKIAQKYKHRKGNIMKRKISLILTLVLMLSTLVTVSVSAASWPSLGAYSYCEFIAPKTINVYTSMFLSTRGTSSPSKKYNAYIDKGDSCRIFRIDSKYIHLAYPTSSGYKQGFIKRSDIFSVSSPSESFTSKASVTTYKYAGSSSYGSTAKNDAIYKVGTSGNYTQIIYTAKSGSRAYKAGWVSNSDYNKIKGVSSPTPTPKATTKFAWPVGGNGGYDNKNWPKYNTSGNYHSGTDITADRGTPVYAAYSGTVDTVKSLKNSYGNYIIIKCNVDGETVYMYYAHLNSFNVKVGATVKTGQQIGTVGNTGNSSGPHLHFEVRNSSKHYGNIGNPTLNPYNYLPKR